MELHWNAWAFANTVQGLFATGLAIVIFRAAPGKLANRSLALFLFLLSFPYSIDGYVDNDPQFQWAFSHAISLGNGVFIPCYLLFLSTLESPLSRPLRSTWVRRALVALAFILPFFFLANWDKFNGPIEHGAFGWDWGFSPGPWSETFGYLFPVLTFYAFAVSVTTLFAAPKGSLARQKARAYSIAFAFFDLWVGVTNIVFTLLSKTLFGTIDYNKQPYAAQLFQSVAGLVVFTMFFSLIAYGILKTQLFDIDIKIKWTVRQGTVAAVFLAVFLIFSAVAQSMLGQQFGLVGGGIAAGLLAFGVTPVQRIADRFANRAMPNVKTNSADYLAFKKLQIYRAAIEAALQDGVVTEKERAVIDTLRIELDVGTEDARAVEEDVRRIYKVRSSAITV